MSLIGFFSELRNKGIKLWLEGESLKYQAPKGLMTEELLGEIIQRKEEIITFLKQVADNQNSSIEPIPKVKRDGQAIEVSYSQQSLWFFDRLNPDNPVYNIPNAFRIKGKLDINAVESALNEIIKRHEILRTTFGDQNGKPVQIITPDLQWRLKVTDFQKYQGLEAKEKIRERINEDAWRAFDLEKGPLWRFNLYNLSPEEYLMTFTIHHIISDAWSNVLFFTEFFKLYEAFTAGSRLDLPSLPIQFGDYASWQRRRFDDRKILEPLLTYWKKQLAGYSILELPTDHPRLLTPSFAGSSQTILLPGDLSAKIKELCASQDITIFMLLLAVFEILLYRYSGQEDVIVGTVVANRSQPEVSGLIGFIMNTLVLRNDLSGNPTFAELLQRVKNITLDAFTHQELPFDLLLEELKPERDISRTPLFQVMYIHQNATDTELQIQGLQMRSLEIQNKAAPFDLRLITQETPAGILCRLDYCTALYKDSTILVMLNHYRNLIEGVVADSSTKIGELPLLSAAEQHQILEGFNNTTVPYPTDRLIHELFEEQVRSGPDRTAVVFEGQPMTYLELNQRANQLAHYLRKLGVGPDVTVGVCLERSFEMVISLLGILKAGGAYVPFDPNYPQERVEYMIENAKVKVLITVTSLLERIPGSDRVVICLDEEETKILQENCVNVDSGVSKDNLAYIIYTSGSTGLPKGAMNTHWGLLNHKLWMQEAYQLTQEDRVLQKTPFSFDVSVWEFFWPLITGATLVMARPEGHKDPQYLIKIIVEQGITIIHFVPSMLSIFLEQPNVRDCISLRQVFCSGEALSINLLHKYRAVFKIPIHNVYGPAECSDVSTAWTDDGAESVKVVPIGKPISNVRVYILDQYRNPVPIGVAGELYVGGVSVGKGYINNAKLTKERFLPDPFSPNLGPKMYKTGDLARFMPDGNIEYLGRSDFQVKIRGFRVELGEIEQLLSEYPRVKGNAVIAQEKENGEKYLVAYIVSQDGQRIETTAIREYLRNKLPQYMVPSAFVFMDRLPLNPNGKLDRKALPAPDFTSVTGNDYVAPRNEIEAILADIWKEVIGIAEIGINDNFFEIGGHSLLLTQVNSKMTEVFKREFSLIEMFTYPTISALAAYVAGDAAERTFSHNEDRIQKQKEAKRKRKELNRRGA